MFGFVECVPAPRADAGELWQRANFEAPAFVVGEMPVQAVELVKSHQVEEFFYAIFGLKISGDVEMQAAIAKPRRVFDMDRVEHELAHRLAMGFDRGEREQRLHAVKHAGRTAADDLDSFFGMDR